MRSFAVLWFQAMINSPKRVRGSLGRADPARRLCCSYDWTARKCRKGLSLTAQVTGEYNLLRRRAPQFISKRPSSALGGWLVERRVPPEIAKSGRFAVWVFQFRGLDLAARLAQSPFPFWGSAEAYARPRTKSTPAPLSVKSRAQNQLVCALCSNDPHKIIKKSFAFPQVISRQLPRFV